MKRRTIVYATGFTTLLLALGIGSAVSIRGEENGFEDSGYRRSPLDSVWNLKGPNGETVEAEDFKDKVVVLDFWATWCPPCKKEIPNFIKLQETYGKRGFAVIGVSLDEKGPRAVNPFIRNFGINYTILLGDPVVVRAFGPIQGLPTTFIIDRSGRVVVRHVGFAPKETFEAEIEALL